MWQLAHDTIGTEDIDALADWLRTYPRLTQGEVVREFEAAWSRWLGADHSVMVTSGTTANFAMIAEASRRVKHRPPRVGVAAVTWSTNVSPSLLLGHDVVVFDVSSSTLGIDEAAVLESMERGELDILFVTHLLGFNALTQSILDTAEANGVIVLEDVCESHGARFGERRLGSVSLAGSFSFYFGHHMSTIEGGIISTNSSEFADALRLMRAHGLARESSHYRELAEQYPEVDERFLFVTTGLNFRSTELNAFLGLRQLQTLDERIDARNANLDRFLRQAPEWLWTDFDTAGVSSFALPLIARDATGADIVRRTLNELDIESRPVVAGNLLRQPFVSGHGVTVAAGATPIADHIHRFGQYVGNGHHVTLDMVDALTDKLKENA